MVGAPVIFTDVGGTGERGGGGGSGGGEWAWLPSGVSRACLEGSGGARQEGGMAAAACRPPSCLPPRWKKTKEPGGLGLRCGKLGRGGPGKWASFCFSFSSLFSLLTFVLFS